LRVEVEFVSTTFGSLDNRMNLFRFFSSGGNRRARERRFISIQCFASGLLGAWENHATFPLSILELTGKGDSENFGQI
jgi:hypothetical protein